MSHNFFLFVFHQNQLYWPEVNTNKEFDFFLFLSMNSHTKRHTAVVQHKLIGFADIDLQVIVVAPCEEALCQSSVYICK